MTQQAVETLRWILAWGWRFMTGYYIPGTNVTPGAIMFFILFVNVAIRFIRSISDVSSSSKRSED